MNSTDLNIALAGYLDARLAETVCDDLEDARLYGLEVVDPDGIRAGVDGAARFVCIGEGCADVLLDGPARLAAHAHDAVALVSAGRSFRLDDDGRAIADGARRRVIVTVVGSPDGSVGSVLRDCESATASTPGPVAGRLADAFGALWTSGSLTTHA